MKKYFSTILAPLIVALVIYLASLYSDYLSVKGMVIEHEKTFDKIDKKLDKLETKIDHIIKTKC